LARRRHGLEDEEGGEEDALAPIGALRAGSIGTMPRESGGCTRRREPAGWRIEVGPMSIAWYLAVSAIVFTLGAIGVITRRNPLVVLLCLELMLNGGNLALICVLADVGKRRRADSGDRRDDGRARARSASASE